MRLDGAARRIRREYNQQISQAWITAALGRAKKMPKLDRLLVRDKPTPKRQTWEQMLAVARAWHEAVNLKKRK